MPERCKVIVDSLGFVTADGVKIGLLVQLSGGGTALQVCDKDRRRSAERGTRLVQVPIQDLAKLEGESQVEQSEKETTKQ